MFNNFKVKGDNRRYMLLRIKMLYNTLLYAQTYRCLYLPTLNAL